jgi:hypothetical protein
LVVDGGFDPVPVEPFDPAEPPSDLDGREFSVFVGVAASDLPSPFVPSDPDAPASLPEPEDSLEALPSPFEEPARASARESLR